MSPSRTPLPIDGHLEQIVAALFAHKALVLGAPPGTGKTTRVPGAVLDSGVLGKVIVLEPRRLAARAAARRVAFERNSAVGAEVGYRVRHDRKTSAATRIEFVTEGVLVRQLLSDPLLEGVGAVVLDEFHERHLEGDLALAMLSEVRTVVRPDLLLVVMSATLDPAPLLRFLPGATAMAVASPLHPVQVVYSQRAAGRDLAPAVSRTVRQALSDTAGDLLVFLPGVGEIRAAAEELGDLARAQNLLLLPLHGQLPAEDQDRAVRPADRRKVVLATNVAESSLTIEGVTAVIDSGLARVLRFDPSRGLDILRLETISRASAEQRKGRAGRTAPGTCYRLWSKADERGMSESDTPEVRRVDLTGPALEVRAFAGRDPREFAWFEAPDAATLTRADSLLRSLGALDLAGRVTRLGTQLLQYPLHPRLARILIAAEQDGMGRAAGLAVALVSERDVFRDERPGTRRALGPDKDHDLLERVEVFSQLVADGLSPSECRRVGVDLAGARSVVRAWEQVTSGMPGDRAFDVAGLRFAILLGYPDRVGLREPAPAREARICGGRGALVPELAARDPHRLFVAISVRETDVRVGARAAVEILSWVEEEDLRSAFPAAIKTMPVVEFDAEKGRVAGRAEERYEDLVLANKRLAEVPYEEAMRVLETNLRPDPWRWLGDAKSQRPLRDLLGRLRWLREGAPELGMPLADEALVAAVAAATLMPDQSLFDLQSEKVVESLLARLDHEQRRALERHAPAHLVLPTGRSARVEYGQRGPSVAVRMQELFGLTATPRLCGGRVPLTIEILAPNHRPVQITQDLESFWKNIYPQVRSELGRRYPRHSWPEDPTKAAPESRPRPRRR